MGALVWVVGSKISPKITKSTHSTIFFFLFSFFFFFFFSSFCSPLKSTLRIKQLCGGCVCARQNGSLVGGPSSPHLGATVPWDVGSLLFGAKVPSEHPAGRPISKEESCELALSTAMSPHCTLEPQYPGT